MLLRVLGPLEVDVDQVPVVVPGRRPRAVLIALMLQPNSVVPTHRLAEAVWGEGLPDKVHNALHANVARLRRALGQAGEAIVTRPPGYLLEIDASTIDAARFEALCRDARERIAGEPLLAARLLDEALALWRGPAYGEFADSFARSAATRLEEMRVDAVEDRAALTLQVGSPAEAVATARDLAAEHPLRERPVELLMRALHEAGRTGEALEVYRHHRELVADTLGLDPSLVLRDLETRILRDEPRLPATRAAAAVASPLFPRRVPPSHLPWRPAPLIGRDHELRLLLAGLSTTRLVTLVGPGGVGKTRLVLEVAHRTADEGRSVWWVDLAAVSAERVVDALAQATGVEVRRTPDPVRSLCSALAGHRGLLCLDNAEHLLSALASVVEGLMEAAPGLTVLITSRERLALDTEVVRALPPLPLPAGADAANPAVRLFCDRATGLQPDLLTTSDIGLIAEVCRRLDGLPLAVELGAARAATLGVPELADRLGERLDLLGSGRRTAAPRHRTLRAVLDWSHELLTGDEALVFARLAVFPGAFALDQAESVCADERLPGPAIAPLVARLIDQSLVQARPGQYWLLETLRAYAWERLEGSGEVLQLRQRHAQDTARRLVALDAQLWTADEAAAVVALTRLLVDLHAAWEYAVDHDRSLAVQLAGDVYTFAYLRQRLDLLHWGVVVASWDGDRPGLPAALAVAAAAAWAGGRFDEAREYARRGIDLAGGPDHPAAALALGQSGIIEMFEGRLDEAAARFRAAADLLRGSGDHVAALQWDIAVAQALTYAGRSPEARIPELVARARASGNPTSRSWACYIAGEAAAAVDTERALAAYGESIAHGSEVDNRLFVALARSSSVALAARGGTRARALEEFRDVLEQWEQLGNESARWWALLNLVVLLARTGADQDAARLAGAVLAARDRQPLLAPYLEHLERALGDVRSRLGPGRTDDALEAGATLTDAAAVAHARQAIRSAQEALRT